MLKDIAPAVILTNAEVMATTDPGRVAASGEIDAPIMDIAEVNNLLNTAKHR